MKKSSHNKTVSETASQTASRSIQPELPVPSTTHSGKPLRVDGIEARTRLLDSALQLFAGRGYAKTSTREIARVAEVNISAISYYFGDKAGLYRAVFNDPRSNPNVDPAIFEQSETQLRDILSALMCSFTDSLKQGEMVEQCMKLHFREMLEPTGLWGEEIDTMIRPAHQGLVRLLCRYLGIRRADDDVHRLAFSVTGLAVSLMVSRDLMQVIRPALIARPKAIDVYSSRLADYAMAMCEDEKRRRFLHSSDNLTS
ncbi:CerR family C-terminal domain-containing protein [Undibacterium sp. Di26W]|uniref:CerR family C-terminal domain-containing protein n=1 Tax=Undibacterium sp. Di26W TaxID=3413035 RepID=UPI003BF39BA6